MVHRESHVLLQFLFSLGKTKGGQSLNEVSLFMTKQRKEEYLAQIKARVSPPTKEWNRTEKLSSSCFCWKKKGDKTGAAWLHLYFSLHGRAFWHSDWPRGESTKLLSIQRKLPESETGDLNPVINTRFNMERKRRPVDELVHVFQTSMCLTKIEQH